MSYSGLLLSADFTDMLQLKEEKIKLWAVVVHPTQKKQRKSRQVDLKHLGRACAATQRETDVILPSSGDMVNCHYFCCCLLEQCFSISTFCWPISDRKKKRKVR